MKGRPETRLRDRVTDHKVVFIVGLVGGFVQQEERPPPIVEGFPRCLLAGSQDTALGILPLLAE